MPESGLSQGSVSTTPCVDYDRLDALRELCMPDGPDLASELIRDFLRDTPARLTELQVAVATGDARTAERHAHTQKSVSGNVGAMQMSETCRALEMAARAGDLATAGALCITLWADCERVTPLLGATLPAAEAVPTSAGAAGMLTRVAASSTPVTPQETA
jgi:HPt (histidine-containing phosphotransfer) domain-containing protein